jgi:hypothetical protein
MMQRRSFIALCLIGTATAGCSTLKKFTGQRDDTILPGEREDVLPAEQQRNAKPGADKNALPCDPTIDVDCKQAGPQDAISTDNIQ